MGMAEANKYIRELRRRQDDPYLWPDFLTGLPGKNAIIRKLESVYSDAGRYSVAYVRIANIHPYLIKYGPDKHADIIQWAAACLKTSCETCEKCLAGTLTTHDFIVICENKDMIPHLRDAAALFEKKARTFYSKEDREKKTVMSFDRDGRKVNIGLMRLVSVISDKITGTDKSALIHDMGRICEKIERTEEYIHITGSSVVKHSS